MADQAVEEAASTAIQEIDEIESRKNNLTIFRLKDASNDIKEGPKRKKEDMKLLKKILSNIDWNVIKSIFRVPLLATKSS